MSIIGEALLSASINALFDKLASTDLLQFARQEKVHADLKKWEKILRQTYKVLDDAEERQVTDRFVKDWLRELKNLTYDLEDILDEFATEVLRRKLSDESPASTSKLSKLIPVCCSTLNPRSIKFNVKMASEIKEINDKFEKIVELKNNLDLKDNLGGKSCKVRYQRIPATSLNETQIYGRESDKEAILDMLLKDEGGSVGVPVISIIGMGGMGKTTLAQLVFNDVKVETHFDIKAWACISEDFDIARVTKAILQSVAPGTSDVNDLNTLQVELRKKLAGKKIFIVLDDVWHENYEDWTILCRPFEAGSFGSKIVITTRNNSVASMVGSHSTYQLKELSYDNCLSVFTYHSLGKMDFNEHQDFKDIGEKIVKRCQGLPLAAKTLGGLLRSKVRCKDWEDVLDSKIWNLPEEKSGIIPALRVSYYYLPPHLKRCFTYCSIFPKDYVFGMKEMILLWMAEGFLQTDGSEKEVEEMGKVVFEDLYSRSFFQEFSKDSSRFVMHDLINDLAQWAAEDFCFRIENASEGEKQLKIPKNLHHLSYIKCACGYEGIKNFVGDIKNIRTLLLIESIYPACYFLDMLPQLQRLRVLSLKECCISELPNTIGDLKHLRYLELSYTEIENLPDSINKLYNLETLILNDCFYLEKLCSDMGNLIRLRHLYISDARSLEGMPSRIGRLNCLRTLSVYVLYNDVSLGLKELKNLTHLQGQLCISGLEKVNDVEDAKEADCIGKKNLKELELKWDSSLNYSRNFDMETQVLDILQPYQKLEKLTIRGYGGTKLPSWLGNPHLQRLSIENCPNLVGNFPKHLPSLESLCVSGCAQLQMFVPSLPKHCKIRIFKCKEICWSSGDCNKLNSVVLSDISDISGRVFVAEMFLQGPSKVVRVVSVDNKKPTCFWQIGANSMNDILECLGSEFFLITWLMIEDRKEVEQGLACRLQYLELRNCECLIKLPQVLHSLSFLRGLVIEYCPQLTSIPDSVLPSELKYIRIKECNALESLPKSWIQSSNTSLESLLIENCDSLRYIARVQLPPNLKKLYIHGCSSLLTVVDEENVNNGSFRNKYALDYSKIVSRGNLTSLQTLSIERCPGIVSIPEDGFPTNLISLGIENVNFCKSLFEWGLHRLSSLKALKISGGCPDVMSFPQEEIGMMLPTSLTTLSIFEFPNLERLSSSIQNLTSLEQLSLWNCPKLKSFPEKGLPVSLLRLYTCGCPLLKQNCKNEEGLYWPMIARIPEVYIDGELVKR